MSHDKDHKIRISTHYEQKRKAVNLSSQSAKTEAGGINCGNRDEILPELIEADCETTIKGKHNAYIVMGRDRPRSIHSGYGGKGYKGPCGMIDIVVGKMHPDPRTEFKYKGEEKPTPVAIDPLLSPFVASDHGLIPGEGGDTPVKWATDAARIYISQKTDIDDNFGLNSGPKPQGGKRHKAIGMSGIGIKADAVRIIGNKSVKIVTNPHGKNSSGSPQGKDCGIHLIANNDSSEKIGRDGEGRLAKPPVLHPLVKGENLRALLDETLEEVIKLSSTVDGLCTQVTDLAWHFGSHCHDPAVPGMPVWMTMKMLMDGLTVMNTVNALTVGSLMGVTENLNELKSAYLTPMTDTFQVNKRYINSSYNKTN